MLVLTRSQDEGKNSITLDGDIEVKILGYYIKDGKVFSRIGIDAPDEVDIVRTELIGT